MAGKIGLSEGEYAEFQYMRNHYRKTSSRENNIKMILKLVRLIVRLCKK